MPFLPPAFHQAAAGLSAVAGGLIGFDELQLGTFLALTLLGIGAVLAGARWGAARNRSP